MPEKNITFEIREHIGVITSFDSGWNRELNIISWNGNAPKYDIRDWDPHHERMKKGITLHEAEMRRLVELYLNNNSQKAVEAGRTLEAERKRRRQDQREARAAGAEGFGNGSSGNGDSGAEGSANGNFGNGSSGNYFEAAADADTFEGAQPPIEEPPEGAELEPAVADEAPKGAEPPDKSSEEPAASQEPLGKPPEEFAALQEPPF